MPVRQVVGAMTLLLACSAATAGAAVLCSGPVHVVVTHRRSGAGWADLPLDVWLTALASVVVAAGVLWLALVTAAAVVEALGGAPSALVRAVSPSVVRRAVAVVCGVAVGVCGVGAASAAPGDDGEHAASAADLLTGLPLPDRTTGTGPPPQATAPTRAAAPHAEVVPASTEAPTYRVRPGDCLWSVAGRLIGSERPGDVDAAWRVLYRANRPLVGADPDLLRTGTVLRVPTALSPESPSTNRRKDAS